MKFKIILGSITIILALWTICYISSGIYAASLEHEYVVGYKTGKVYGEKNSPTKIDSVFYLDACTKDNPQYFVIVLSDGKILFLDKFASNDYHNYALLNKVKNFIKLSHTKPQNYIMDNDCI